MQFFNQFKIMKKTTITIIAILVSSIIVYSQNPELTSINDRVTTIEKIIKTLQKSNEQLKRENRELNGVIIKQQNELSALKENVQANTENIKKTVSETGDKIKKTNASIVSSKTNLEQKLKSKSIFVAFIMLITIIILVVIYFLLLYRINISKSAIHRMSDTQKILHEEALRLDGKLIEILEKQIKIQDEQPISPKEKESDHSLVLKVADEIIRIETNLSRMDSSIKGFKQLSASVRRIKDNFLANDYELIDMLGKPYDEGMRVFADFVIDENLKNGERIITTIIKPQINFKGELIQKAKITVSQNI